MDRIRHPLRLNKQSDAVSDLHEALSALNLTVKVEERARQRFGTSTREKVRAFQEQHDLATTGDVDQATAQKINVLLTSRIEDQGHPHYRVRGSVRDEHGTGIEGLTVTLTHRTLKVGGKLGTTSTSKKGFYDIVYVPPGAGESGQSGSSNFTLMVHVSDDRFRPRRVVHPQRAQWVNFNAGDAPYKGTAVYDAMMSAAGPHLEGLEIQEITQTEEQPQVTILAGESGLSTHDVMTLVLSHRLAAQTGAEPQLFFAFLQQSLPADLPSSLLHFTNYFEHVGVLEQRILDGVALMERRAQRDAIERAARKNLISHRSRWQLDALNEVIAELRTERALEHRPNGVGKTPLRSLLDLTDLNEEQYGLFANLYVEHDGQEDELWKALEDRGDTLWGDAADDVKRTLTIGRVTRNHPPLVKHFVARDRFRDPRQMATLTLDEWKQQVREAGGGDASALPENVREGYEGMSEEGLVEMYASELQGRAEVAFPTMALAARMARTDASPLQHTDDILRLIDSEPALDLLTMNVDRYLEERQPDVSLSKESLEEVKALQRSLKLAAVPHAAETLLREGIHCSGQLYRMGRTRAVDMLTGAGLTVDLAGKVFDRAEHTHAMLFMHLLRYGVRFNPGSVRGILDQDVGGMSEEEANQFPNLENLFGSVDFCDCPHCRSLYSPAAYYTDILHFLEEKEAEGHPNALDVLLARRPDLGHILLNCENTNTPVPYIDLVCEVLEREVAGVEGASASDWPQTTWSAEELRAQPEHVLPEAYRQLTEAMFPMSAPFDLALVEARTYLGHLGLKRYDVMEAFQDRSTDPAAPSDTAIAAEYFGLGQHEIALVTQANTDTAHIREVWHVDDPVRQLSSVEVFLDRAGIDYGELRELLGARFANPASTRTVIRRSQEGVVENCDVSKQSLTNLSLERLDRMHRFLRLWRAVPWAMWELDLLVRDLSGNTVDFDKLHAFRKLQDTTGLSTDVLVSFYSPLNTEANEPSGDGAKPLYQRLFLDKTILDESPGDSEFAVDKVTSPNPPGRLSTTRAAVQAALGLQQGELDLLLTKTDDTLSLANLSILHRYAQLSRVLGMSVHQMDGMLEMVGVSDPFSSLDVTERVIADATTVRTSDLRIDELDYLFHHRPEADARPEADHFAGIVGRLRTLCQQEAEKVQNGSETPEKVAARTLARLEAFDDPSVVDAAVWVIEGSWNEPLQDGDPPRMTDQERVDLIENHFDKILNVSEATQKLGALQHGSGAARENEVADRFAYVFRHLRRHLSADAVRDEVARAFRLEAQHAATILDEPLRSDLKTHLEHLLEDRLLERDESTGEFVHDVSVSNFPHVFETLERLHKAATLILRHDLSPARLAWLVEQGQAGGFPNPAALPVATDHAAVSFDMWRTLTETIRLDNALRKQEDASLFDIHEKLQEGAGTDAVLDAVSIFAEWDREALGTLVTGLALESSTGLSEATTYERLRRCFGQMERTGVGPATMMKWAGSSLDLPTAAAIKQAAKAKYDASRWREVAVPLQDEIRNAKREALVDHLVAHPSEDEDGSAMWNDKNSLYAHFLIDVEMSACQMSSRIKQAISTAQLFVQRSVMNLESAVMADADEWNEWAWMKNYRVWEANRKVFLYPENWIEPELRTTKSPFFEELESNLQQGELTHESAERALRGYLRNLEQVAKLEVVAIYHEEDTGTDVVHVFSRSRGEPASYYYRTLVNGARWTAWEPVDLEIKGDHLVPVVYNRKLHLFWPVFHERPETEQMQAPADSGDMPKKAPKARQVREIRMAWSVYEDGAWSKERISGPKLLHPWPRPTHAYHFKPRPQRTSDRHLHIDLFITTSRDFNEVKFYDPKSDTWKPLTTNKHSFTKRPWHSSTFVFNGDVIDVQLKEFGRVALGDDHVTHLDYIQERYGEDGRAIRRLERVEPHLMVPALQHFHNNRLVPNPAGGASLNVIADRNVLGKDGTLLLNTPSSASSIVSLQDRRLDLTYRVRPFFYQDDDRAFVAAPERAYWTGQYLSEESGSGRSVVTRHVFRPFYHPFTRVLRQELNHGGVDGLLRRDLQVEPERYDRQDNFSFSTSYRPTRLADATHGDERIDFSVRGAYSQYNWELFFHAPLLIADRLRQNQRFEEALRWFHYIFDPTSVSDEEVPKRYWIPKPFFEMSSRDYREQSVRGLMGLIAEGDEETEAQVEAWREQPFHPHVIARLRPVAYQRAVLMKYLDTLIAWGDQLFRRFTIESINEATQLYVRAAEILGERPTRVPATKQAGDRTYLDIHDELDDFSNAVVEVESILAPPPASRNSGSPGPPLPRLETLYFGIPHNEELQKYWDRVEDRLYKVRHCMDVEGREREMSLFEPPIDPEALVRAAASGADLDSVLSQSGAPRPPYRFQVVHQSALTLCNEVRSLGNALQSALEKRDAEEMSRLRSTHEIRLQEAVHDVRALQIEEAEHSLEGLRESRASAQRRLEFFQSRPYLNQKEELQIAKTAQAETHLRSSEAKQFEASILSLLPNATIGASGFSSPVATFSFGGPALAGAARAISQFHSNKASRAQRAASLASILGGYDRRADDWQHQAELAEIELEQIDNQIQAAETRRTLAEKELSNHELRIEQAEAADDVLRSKFTNQELYDWTVSQLSSVYFQTYQLAYDVAKRAERTFQYELDEPDTSFVQFGYWDSLRKGLLAGDKLSFDLRRMESAYQERNIRRLELTKHVSLAQIAPMALLVLKETGECTIELPEALFDLDYPGHYLRRLKSVSISIPCVVGPYTGVHCTLTLLKNSARTTSRLGGSGYARQAEVPDDRFQDSLAAVQSIATSHAQNDSGLFELNFRDERYLPFEGAGAISTWRISLPPDTNRFDFDTLSDVILHLNYTARDGGQPLASAARSAVIDETPREGAQLLNLRRDFPSRWHAFLHPSGDEDQVLELDLGPQHFPFYARGKTLEVTNVEIVAQLGSTDEFELLIDGVDSTDQPTVLERDGSIGEAHYGEIALQSTAEIGLWTLRLRRKGAQDFRSLSPDEIKDLELVIHFNTSSS